MHPLKGNLAIDIDGDHLEQWGGGLPKLARVRVNNRPVKVWFFDPHEKRPNGSWWATSFDLDQAAALGAVPGMRYVTHWDDGAAPEDAAKIGSDHIARLDAEGTDHAKRRVQVVEWDVEMQAGAHDVGWQTKFLLGYTRVTNQITVRHKGIRGRGGEFPKPSQPDTLGWRWARPFVWTMEGRQDVNSSAAYLAAGTGDSTQALIGPQCYDGPMEEIWDPWFEILTWCLDANPDRQNGATVPVSQFIPYYDARRSMRLQGVNETVMFATSRLNELYE